MFSADTLLRHLTSEHVYHLTLHVSSQSWRLVIRLWIFSTHKHF